MANPRELAEKAFTLLQDALRESESRATELDAELKRRREPKTRSEERLEVLAHRLESVEAECQRWQREVGRFEELLENERVKVQQLRKKLEVAESGPDKLTKKEVNFWRQRAEQFDVETREYKNRIAALKQDLEARAAPGDGFDFGFGTGSTGTEGDLVSALEAAREESNALRRRVETQTAELAALQARLAGPVVRDPHASAQSADLPAVENLRAELAAAERTLADSEQGRAALAREHSSLTEKHKALAGELENARREIGDSRQTASEAETAHGRMVETLRERDTRLVEMAATLERMRADLTTRDEREQALRAELDRGRETLAASAARAGELEHVERAAAAREHDLAAALADRDGRMQALGNELERIREEFRRRETEVRQLQDALGAREAALGQARTGAERMQKELAELAKRGEAALGEHRSNIQALRNELAVKNELVGRIQPRVAELEQEIEAAREQLAGLEAELKEEKECAANLNEVANERREALTRLEERVEEADERYEEAKWQLGKAQHFERLVRRRKGLIAALLAALRAKSKANSALKAGLDGLRTYKATSEANQQKLLARIDKLGTELKEAEDTIAKHHGATFANEQFQTAQAKIADLEGRLNTQVEIIQTLESELKAAKAMHQTRDRQTAELEQARKELEARNEIVARLEADADEQQRKFAKLRGSESETVRLRALEEKDRDLIDALQREISQLRDALSRQAETPAAGGGAQGDLANKLKERDGSITRLMATVKEKDAEIAKLKESAAQWKKKYEFLSTEAPQAYQSVVEK